MIVRINSNSDTGSSKGSDNDEYDKTAKPLLVITTRAILMTIIIVTLMMVR